MITAYTVSDMGLLPVQCAKSHVIPDQAIWLDIHAADAEEVANVEAFLGFSLPSHDQIREIEISSRIYNEDGRTYITVLAPVGVEKEALKTLDITFILTRDRLITLRYGTAEPFTAYVARTDTSEIDELTPIFVFADLLETFIDNLADILERAGYDIDDLAVDVFHVDRERPVQPGEFSDLVRRIGRADHFAVKARESLNTTVRALIQLGVLTRKHYDGPETRTRVKIALRDCQQLIDHSSYLSSRTSFLMDATTGLISIEQNNIIKLFSVAAVALMPPTLIASIYGMNFQSMPELDSPWGYPITVVAMIVSAIVPYIYFRMKGWL